MKTAIIMTRAHELTRATRAIFADADYRATFRAALAIAWSESRANAAPVNDPRAEWDAMSGNAQADALTRMVKWCMNRDKAETDRNGNFRPNYFNWISCADDITATAHEAYTRIDAAFANAEKAIADGKRDSMPSIRAIMANAARSAARYIARQEYKHASALRIESKTDEDGNIYMREYIKTDDAATAEPIAPNPETATLIADAVSRACKDDTDRAIVSALARGYSMREIAPRLGMSQPAISKRVKAIRERYSADNTMSHGYGMTYAPANA